MWQISCRNCHIGKMPYTFWQWQFFPMRIFQGIIFNLYSPPENTLMPWKNTENKTVYIWDNRLCVKGKVFALLDFHSVSPFSGCENQRVAEKYFSYQEATRSRDTKSEIPFQPKVTFSSHSCDFELLKFWIVICERGMQCSCIHVPNCRR